MSALTVEIINNIPVSKQAVEIVERKGTGHPDYICDAAMDAVSVALSREYIKRTGTVLHHNIDKGLLVAGRVEKGFGWGRVKRPMEIIVGDRAAYSVGRKRVRVKEIAERTVREWFSSNLKHVDQERDLIVKVVCQPGSEELAGIFSGKKGVRGANDTSAAVGYAPLTLTEKAVFESERFLNSQTFKTAFPETGEDVKVMGFRKNQDLDLTIALPLMAKDIKNEKEYFRKKNDIIGALRGFTGSFPFRRITLNYNTLDARSKGTSGVYLTLTGTSAEDADSGQVGRGNRVNGVISLNRPTGTEAAAGKNPVSHVGKIYTVLAYRMAGEVYEKVDGAAEVYVWFLSQIGSPVDRPKHISVQIISCARLDTKKVSRTVGRIADEFLSGIGDFTDGLTRGEYPVC
ncbi:MAG: methionine adenosyltransferase [Deltaproteobacteria bacterium]|nr:methionine adenosyltransferase [Deltaproteobacteria bacterium]